ncbi:MAG TPA: YbaN family protein [Allosphingosinicella sp.]|jgi:hypothetical protein
MRLVYLLFGSFSLLLGLAGVFLPLLPTVPFVILAAFCFARGHPPLEAWLLRHPAFGPHISAWRKRGAIGRKAKRAALAAFALSAALGLLLLPMPLSLTPAAAALVGGRWVWIRPE